MNAELVPVPDRDPAPLEGDVISPSPRVVPLRVIATAARHPHTKTTGRHLAYIPLGVMAVTKRLWESRSAARYDRFIRAAEAAGNLDAALEWEKRLADFRRDRHARRVDMLEVPARLILDLPRLLFRVFLLLALTGLALWLYTGRLASVAVPVQVVAWSVAVAVAFITATWMFLLAAAIATGLGALYWAGRVYAAGGDAPRWAATTTTGDIDVSIDETTIARALDALRIPQISGYLKEGVQLQYLTPCRRDGRGTHAVIRLPSGVTAERIGRRRADFATGVYRLAKEVWPSTGDEEGILDVWIADKGALNAGAGPYPLADDEDGR